MKYQANPVHVDAEIIIGIGSVLPDGSLHLALQNGENFTADHGMIARYIPAEGDYVVTQEDGYRYVNPKHVFERKYSPVSAFANTAPDGGDKPPLPPPPPQG